MAFDELNEKPREFMIAVLTELREGGYPSDSLLRTAKNVVEGVWYVTLDGRPILPTPGVDEAILAELEDTKYLRPIRKKGHIREYSFIKKAHNEY